MKIVTNCAADMPAEERASLDVLEALLYIQFSEGEINSAALGVHTRPDIVGAAVVPMKFMEGIE